MELSLTTTYYYVDTYLHMYSFGWLCMEIYTTYSTQNRQREREREREIEMDPEKPQQAKKKLEPT